MNAPHVLTEAEVAEYETDHDFEHATSKGACQCRHNRALYSLRVARAALVTARASLLAWNQMGSGADAEEITRLYEQSPEIKAIDAALGEQP